MKKLLFSILLVAFAFGAHAAAPDSASVEKLVRVMRVEKTMSAMERQMDDLLHTLTDQLATSRALSADDRKALDAEMTAEMKTVHDFLTWDHIQPVYYKVYSDTFTQEEVDGMIAFYQTPTGQSVLSKMPGVLQKTVAIIQPQLMQLTTNIQADLQRFAETLAAKHGQKQG
jgi:hypothetical protein